MLDVNPRENSSHAPCSSWSSSKGSLPVKVPVLKGQKSNLASFRRAKRDGLRQSRSPLFPFVLDFLSLLELSLDFELRSNQRRLVDPWAPGGVTVGSLFPYRIPRLALIEETLFPPPCRTKRTYLRRAAFVHFEPIQRSRRGTLLSVNP
jgi:hypothetical protein